VPVFFERIAGIEDVFLGERDCRYVRDTEVDACNAVACCGGGSEVEFADEVQLPLVAGLHRPNRLDALYIG
jgi:hypothetical protein